MWASYALCIIDPKENYWAWREDTRTKEFWFFEPVEGGPTDGGAEKRHEQVPRAACRVPLRLKDDVQVQVHNVHMSCLRNA